MATLITNPQKFPVKSIDLDHFSAYPVLVSPKLDGIGCVIGEGSRALSIKLKPIPNLHIRKTLQSLLLERGLHGELVTYTENVMDSYNVVQSKVMSESGTPSFTLWIYDIYLQGLSFRSRLAYLSESIHINKYVCLLTHNLVGSKTAVEDMKKSWYKFEGLILRNPDAHYHPGRATETDCVGWKLKRYEDSEAMVISILPAYENTNEPMLDELGNTKRSKHQEGMVQKEEMGKLVVRDIHHPEWPEFEIGSGFTQEDRKLFWSFRTDGIFPDSHSTIKYKYQAFGMDKRPRQPIYLGIRNPIDL